MARKILHIDLDAFFCAVEELHNPELRGKAFAVGGLPEQRGVVASCSYAARRFGVRSAMPMARALKLCPGLVVVSSRHAVYSQLSRQVMERLHRITPLVEQVSIDEAFLDVSDLTEPAEVLARRLQTTIREELELPCSLGVASNKLMAKIANDVGKASKRGGEPPNAITVVPPGQEAAFLEPLPLETLWGVGPKTAQRLGEIGIHTIGELARWPESDLVQRLGKNGHDLAERAHGIDDRPILTSHEAKSISEETTFSKDIRDGDQLLHTLQDLSEGVGRRLRRSQQTARTVKIKLRWADFTTLTRQTTLPYPSDQDRDIYQAARQLFEKAWQKGKLVRLLGVGVSGLGPQVRQLKLWEDGKERDRRLQAALDELRQRFGEDVLQRGSEIDKD